jgi:hypothetical protein
VSVLVTILLTLSTIIWIIVKIASQFSFANPALICPHCQVGGRCVTKKVSCKKGISGGKATAAVLTGGVSLLATGLSRKEIDTEAHCKNCNSTWYF